MFVRQRHVDPVAPRRIGCGGPGYPRRHGNPKGESRSPGRKRSGPGHGPMTGPRPGHADAGCGNSFGCALVLLMRHRAAMARLQDRRRSGRTVTAVSAEPAMIPRGRLSTQPALLHHRDRCTGRGTRQGAHEPVAGLQGHERDTGRGSHEPHRFGVQRRLLDNRRFSAAPGHRPGRVMGPHRGATSRCQRGATSERHRCDMATHAAGFAPHGDNRHGAAAAVPSE